MRILSGKNWKNDFLDYHRNKSGYRIRVLAWKNLEKLEHVYHTRPKSLRLLINYFPVVGPVGLFTKTWSRLREDRRNDKYIACGIGKIIEAPGKSEFAEGETVAFLAPWHPALAERIVLPRELIFKTAGFGMPEMPTEAILYQPLQDGEKQNKWWEEMKAWSVYSGTEISNETRKRLESGIREEMKSAQIVRVGAH